MVLNLIGNESNADRKPILRPGKRQVKKETLIATVALILNGALNPLAWGIVAVYLFFTAGFGCFALRKEQAD